MVIQQTSILAYKELNAKPLELGQRQYEVYNFLLNRPFGCNNRLIAEKLGKPINSITPRVKELRDMGLVVEHHRDVDKITKKAVIFWGVNDE